MYSAINYPACKFYESLDFFTTFIHARALDPPLLVLYNAKEAHAKVAIKLHFTFTPDRDTVEH